MLDESELRALVTHAVVYRGRKQVGYVETIFNDRETGRPEWLGVMTGTLRPRHRLVPVADVQKDGVTVVLPWTGKQVKSAPDYGNPDEPISEELEREAYRHYGREPAVR